MKTQQAPEVILRRSLTTLLKGQDLSAEHAADTFLGLSDVHQHACLKSAVLTAMASKGASPTELAGIANSMLGVARGPIAHAFDRLVDTCGTGGDGSLSFNISSACALVVASLGIPVAKHGNRSVSSASGSADFFEALGVPLDDSASLVQASLREHGFAFLHAPHFHPAMAGVAGVRRELGIPTVFNLLGPLVNPARPTHQLIGCTDQAKAGLLAETLLRLDVQAAYVVCGAEGWDEATPCGPFQVTEVRAGQLEQRCFDPREFAIERCAPAQLSAQDGAHNARLMHELLQGHHAPIQDAVVLNAALVLLLTGLATEPLEAADRAREALLGGATNQLLERLTSKD
jgi:anthranilate phosphoribosyltransferase